MLTLEASPAPLEVSAPPSEQHVVCCRDGDVALCGLDVSREPWEERDTSCVVCADLEDGLDDALLPICPITRTVCPD